MPFVYDDDVTVELDAERLSGRLKSDEYHQAIEYFVKQHVVGHSDDLQR